MNVRKPMNSCTCTANHECSNCADWDNWDTAVSSLAKMFCKYVHKYLSEEKIAEAVATQTGLNEYFDANEAMGDACNELGCLAEIGSNENRPDLVQANCDLMDAAWERAMESGYSMA